MKYLIKTLGCKVNQVDSIYLAETLERSGWTRAAQGEPAQICIINTCTVTARTDTQCRQLIRRTVRENPGAKVMVTGCYAEVAPDAVRAIPGVDRVLGNREKRRPREILGGHLASDNGTALPGGAAGVVSPHGSWDLGREDPGLIHGSGGRSRAFVRVQDGCNAFCAYCIVPYARGRLRSEDPDRVVRQVRMLVEKGFLEIVLSGIHLGAYGVDRDGSLGLTRLLRRLVRIQGDFRLRLSSVEPGEVDDELILLAVEEEKVCNHLHIPLQSGDDRILKQMRRPYTTGEFSELVFRLRDKDAKMAIGTDLIVGLPGETDDSFARTCEWISSLPLTHFHIFPYSSRPGTEAASMERQVSPRARKERAARLRDLCEGMKSGFLARMIGNRLKAVPVSDRKGSGGPLNLVTDNYLQGRILDAAAYPLGIFPVKVAGISDDKVLVTI